MKLAPLDCRPQTEKLETLRCHSQQIQTHTPHPLHLRGLKTEQTSELNQRATPEAQLVSPRRDDYRRDDFRQEQGELCFLLSLRFKVQRIVWLWWL